MKWKVKVIVRFKEGFNDLEGRVIGNVLKNFGFSVENLCVFKYFEFEFESERLEEEVEEMCRKLFVNFFIYEWEYSIELVS